MCLLYMLFMFGMCGICLVVCLVIMCCIDVECGNTIGGGITGCRGAGHLCWMFVV